MTTDSIEVRLAHLGGAYEQITARLGAIEGRLARLEDKVDGLEARADARFGRLEARIERLDTKIDTVRSELLSRMDRQFYWILTLVVLSILAPVFLRLIGP